MRSLSRGLWAGFGVITVVFMLSPLVLVVLFSFGRNDLASFPMEGLTLGWYETLFANKDFWIALKNSAIVTGSVGVISTLVGSVAAFGLARLRQKRAEMTLVSLGLPLMMPPLVLALALLSSYTALGFGLGVETVIPSQLVFIQPFVIFVVYARMARFDYAVVESARDLGASSLRAFLTVTLPIIRPTIIGVALIAMALSLDDFIITYFTIGGGMTLPTLVWGMLRTSLEPDINAMAALIIAFTVGSTVLALRITRYRG
jgi:spermidine/putrescine transport system permease protein